MSWINYQDLRSIQDDRKILRNPHKGWYWHYIDNGMGKPAYRDQQEKGDYLHDFPGLNHLYLRIDWSDVQPEENRFDWSYIDEIMDEWGSQGYRFSFRVCSFETHDNVVFATPEWLMKKGCPGQFILSPESGVANWEPDYGAPMFLDYLERFMAVFGGRYDNDPRVEFIDWGSYGTWGEGHTERGSRRIWPVEDMMRHVDIHKKYFHNKPILMNDDHVNSRKTETLEQKQVLIDYCRQRGLGLRDDSVCVSIYADHFGYDTLRTPLMFDQFWKNAPIDIEFEHYHMVSPEIFKSGYPFIASLWRTHATYTGFHGYPRPWLEKWYDLTEFVANRLGYWYFLEGIDMPSTITAGTSFLASFVWRNQGMGLGYVRYKLLLKLTGSDGHSFTQTLDDCDNRKWMPGEQSVECLKISIPDGTPTGEYRVSISLFEQDQPPIQLGIKDEHLDGDGFYYISNLTIH